MDTKQNEERYGVSFGKIDLTKPYGRPKKVQKDTEMVTYYLYPADRIVEFLKVNSNSEKEIVDFCSKYHLIPLVDYEAGIKVPQAFKALQNEIKLVYKHFVDNKLTYKDIETINSHLQEIYSVIVEGDIFLKAETKDNSAPKEFIVIEKLHEALRHKNPWASLWDDLKNIILDKSHVTFCRGCGVLFEKKIYNQKHCNETCATRVRQQRLRRKRQAKTNM